MQNCFGKFALHNNINKMKIAIGNHAGPEYKKAIMDMLKAKGYVINYGTDSTDSVDYPDFGHPVATDVAEGKVDLELLFAEAVTECNDCKQTSKYAPLYVG
jgi:ribose 5-phosphate isomerase B